MNIINSDFNEIYRKNKRIICYGCGMVLAHISPLLEKFGLADRIAFLADSDRGKVGKTVSAAGRNIEIRGISALYGLDVSEYLLLITCENFKDVVRTLDNDPNVGFTEVYPCSYLNYNMIEETNRAYRPPARSASAPKIPPVIHYCWFGKEKMPEEFLGYIQSWKELCSGYEFVLWNEDNYDVGKCLYSRQAYESGKYAFVCDYARLDILYEHGGIYMDTDVELLKNPDLLRDCSAFFTYAEWPAVTSGTCCGAEAGNRIIKRMRDEPRSAIPFINGGRQDLTTNIFYETNIMTDEGFVMDFTQQEINGVRLYSPAHFSCDGKLGRDLHITPYTVAVHHCAGSWKQ